MEKQEKAERVGQLFEEFHHLHEEYGRFWLNETFLRWDWWVSVILAVGPWIFWSYYRKKKSTHRLLYAGVAVMLISLCLDYIGTALGLWYYTGKETPSFPAWLPFNFCMLPVCIMFLIQTKPHIAAWKKGIFFGALTAYLGEPLFVWAGYYVLNDWRYTYSLPIYALIFIFANWLARRQSFSDVL
ncbi:CBO0543 family protein [Salirhabdus sp. Marseille-P4669]|uniref:CBO0543 family protein n=1 Tax=Salirhabdus sp. Marseille-P4669 TaxID=2042310 RepID=UPI000C7E2D5F|nr:CBO0543 family protein [Salirhabdus sp. Marseille-P4669]